ncbi:MAG: alpha/beta hydrolase [Micrococcales bacterium]|nr:alpha/beta hydrolase [Micrococcales bacterium]
MTDLTLTPSQLTPPRPDADLLIVGPSLGTSVTALWSRCVQQVAGTVEVIGWDLPGHGVGSPVAEEFSIEDLAQGVLGLTRQHGSDRRVWYAGVSVGGAVGLQLALEPQTPFAGIAVICSGARIGDFDMWHDRADLVERAGTPTMVDGSAKRWFAPGFLERDATTGVALLNSLQHADARSYANVCRALADFDVRDHLGEIPVPLLAIAGAHDKVCTPEDMSLIAERSRHGRLVIVDDAAHLAPAEQPVATAKALLELVKEGR